MGYYERLESIEPIAILRHSMNKSIEVRGLGALKAIKKYQAFLAKINMRDFDSSLDQRMHEISDTVKKLDEEEKGLLLTSLIIELDSKL